MIVSGAGQSNTVQTASFYIHNGRADGRQAEFLLTAACRRTEQCVILSINTARSSHPFACYESKRRGRQRLA